jgi:hypothetical protein
MWRCLNSDAAQQQKVHDSTLQAYAMLGSKECRVARPKPWTKRCRRRVRVGSMKTRGGAHAAEPVERQQQ